MKPSIHNVLGKAILRIVLALVIIFATGMLIAKGMEIWVPLSERQPPNDYDVLRWAQNTFVTYVNLTFVSMALFLLWYGMMGPIGAFPKKSKSVIGLWMINLGFMVISLIAMVGVVIGMWKLEVLGATLAPEAPLFYPATNALAVLLMWLILFGCTHIFAPDSCYRFALSFRLGELLGLRVRAAK